MHAVADTLKARNLGHRKNVWFLGSSNKCMVLAQQGAMVPQEVDSCTYLQLANNGNRRLKRDLEAVMPCRKLIRFWWRGYWGVLVLWHSKEATFMRGCHLLSGRIISMYTYLRCTLHNMYALSSENLTFPRNTKSTPSRYFNLYFKYHR